jgi:hypothetical protein
VRKGCVSSGPLFIDWQVSLTLFPGGVGLGPRWVQSSPTSQMVASDRNLDIVTPVTARAYQDLLLGSGPYLASLQFRGLCTCYRFPYGEAGWSVEEPG